MTLQHSSITSKVSLNAPFFSIIIPTRGRPDLLRAALVSVLFQEFDDFEVVVSDNGDDDKTQKVVNEFHEHQRLRSIRPDRLLSMPEHWDFASKSAKGIYVMFLTDRSVLKQHALKTIYKTLKASEYEMDVCSWRWSLYDDVSGREFGDTPTRSEGVQVLTSKYVVEDFINGVNKYPYSLPRALNSCYRKETVSMLRERYGTIFRPITPDFTSAFLLLANINSMLYIDQALFISQGLSVSNGGNAFAKTATGYLESLGDHEWLSHVPIKLPLVENIIFQDYLFIQELSGGTLEKVNINWTVYFEKCYRELIEKKGIGLLSSYEIESLYTEWSRALSGFDDSTKYEVHQRISTLWWAKLKAKLKGNSNGQIIRRIKQKIDNVWHYRWKKRNGESVLEAAGFSDKI